MKLNLEDFKPPEKRMAPWTDEEVIELNDFQACKWFHPFTDPINSITMVATNEGWTLPGQTEIIQTWAHDFMFGRWREDAAFQDESFGKFRT